MDSLTNCRLQGGACPQASSLGPARGGVSRIVAMDTLVLARTEEVAVAVTGISAYSTGMEIFLTARSRRDHPEDRLPGGPHDLAASGRSFRLGLQLADGGKAVGRPGRLPEPTIPTRGADPVRVRRGRRPAFVRLPVVGLAAATQGAAGIRLRVAGASHRRIPGWPRGAAYPRRGGPRYPAVAGRGGLVAADHDGGVQDPVGARHPPGPADDERAPQRQLIRRPADRDADLARPTTRVPARPWNAVRSACSRKVTRRAWPGSSGTRAKPASQRTGRTTWATGSLEVELDDFGTFSGTGVTHGAGDIHRAVRGDFFYPGSVYPGSVYPSFGGPDGEVLVREAGVRQPMPERE